MPPSQPHPIVDTGPLAGEVAQPDITGRMPTVPSREWWARWATDWRAIGLLVAAIVSAIVWLTLDRMSLASKAELSTAIEARAAACSKAHVDQTTRIQSLEEWRVEEKRNHAWQRAALNALMKAQGIALAVPDDTP